MAVKFENNSVQVVAALDDACIAYLYEAGVMLQRQAANNTRTDTGDTAGAWDYVVDESKGTCTVGNPMQNAIWEEFGTGEFALKGNGRKGGWVYKDDDGNYHHTYGKTPTRALHNAFTAKKKALINRAKEVLKARMG